MNLIMNVIPKVCFSLLYFIKWKSNILYLIEVKIEQHHEKLNNFVMVTNAVIENAIAISGSSMVVAQSLLNVCYLILHHCFFVITYMWYIIVHRTGSGFSCAQYTQRCDRFITFIFSFCADSWKRF